MLQANAWTSATRMLVALVLAGALAAPLATAQDDPTDSAPTSDDVGREVEIALTWAAYATGLEDGDESSEEEPSEESSGETEEEAEPEPESEQETLAQWLAGQVAAAEDAAVAAAMEAKAFAEQLGHDAEATVKDAPTLLDDLIVVETAEESDASTQNYQAEEAPSVPTAVMVAATVAAAAAAGSLFVMFWTAGSTAGTAGGAAAKGSSGLRKIAPVFSPMFTRFEGREVLEHPNRAELYTLVAANPGVRLQDLCIETSLSRTAVTHHLRLLEQQHLIVSERVGRSRHYYENGGRYEREKKDAYAVLQNDRSKDIANFILTNPGTIQKSMCESLGMRASIAHWHIKRLEEASLVETVRSGRTVNYYPAGGLGQLTF